MPRRALPADEELTREQWMQIADREEKRLGFEGQPRIVTFHIYDNGERHMHIGWCRLDLEEMRAIDPGMYKNHLKQLARDFERDFGLRELDGTRKPEDRAKAPGRAEEEESRRLGTNVREIRTAILDCLERADGGKGFKAALEERGFVLANGDRRDCFVVIDQAGGASRTQQEADRPDAGGDARPHERSRPLATAERRSGEGAAGRAPGPGARPAANRPRQKKTCGRAAALRHIG